MDIDVVASAAYIAVRDSDYRRQKWDSLPDEAKEHWRRVARAVLKAARYDQLCQERDWLRQRAKQGGRCIFTDKREVGVSSNAMVEYALGGPEPRQEEYPKDCADLAACRRARDSAPEHLRSKMDEILDKYEAALKQPAEGPETVIVSITSATREELGGRPVRVKSFGWG